jgi:predicted DNA-binding transcriptional regulator AlpA
MPGPDNDEHQQIDTSRACEQRVEQWQAQHEEWQRLPSYMHPGPDALIAMAETRRPLKPEQLEAFDAAWLAMFGERLTVPAGASAEPPAQSAEPAAPLEPSPDDNDVLGWKAAARVAGVSIATLRREVVAKRFPRRRRISARRVGWDASEVSAWRERLDANRR